MITILVFICTVAIAPPDCGTDNAVRSGGGIAVGTLHDCAYQGTLISVELAKGLDPAQHYAKVACRMGGVGTPS